MINTTDYYPFGSPKPGRNFNSSEHRYGFNGMEKDDEIKGSGNSYDFGERMYDPRIARFIAPDPLMNANATWSPYVFGLNNPIVFIDENGEWPGVRFFYFEFDIGGGLGYGLNYVEQSGVAYDKVGKTHFVMTSSLYIENQNVAEGSSDPEIVAGAAAALKAGFTIDWSANTFTESTRGYSGEMGGLELFDAIGGEIGFGDSRFSLKAGLGLGMKMSVLNLQVKQSISLTKNEAKQVSSSTDVWFESWSLGDQKAILDNDGNITGFSATVNVMNSEGETINTGIRVFSGAVTSKDGTVQSDGAYTSKAYQEQAVEAEKP